MVSKEIKARKDLTLNTRVTSRILVEGEVATVEFENEREFQNLLALGSFEECGVDTPVDETKIPAYRGDESDIPDDTTVSEDALTCPVCSGDMVPGMDGDKEVILCPFCQFEVGDEVETPEETPSIDKVPSIDEVPTAPVETPEVETEVETPVETKTTKKVKKKKKSKRTNQSRCPICKRVKKRSEKYCKKCTEDSTP